MASGRTGPQELQWFSNNPLLVPTHPAPPSTISLILAPLVFMFENLKAIAFDRGVWLGFMPTSFMFM